MHILPSNVPDILLDTDIGNDIDDVLALALLCRLHRIGSIRLVGLSISNGNPDAPAFAAVMLEAFRINVPIFHNPGTPAADSERYLHVYKKLHLEPRLPIERDLSQFLGNTLYRGSGVHLIGIGSSTNLALMFEQLAATAKMVLIRSATIMAGNFELSKSEFNISSDIFSFQQLISYEHPFAFCDYNLGKRIYFDGSVFEIPVKGKTELANQLVRESYLSFRSMPYDRPTWDPCTVLFALRDQFPDIFTETTVRYDFDVKTGIVSLNNDGRFGGRLAGIAPYAAHRLKNTIYALCLGVTYKFQESADAEFAEM